MAELHAHGRAVAGRVATLEERIVRHARQDATARRLATIPGLGPITASLIAATVGDHVGAFRSARHFAARLGLVPRQHSTGGRTRSGGITKAGNAEIRKPLVLGATSMVWRATRWDSKAGLWVRGVLARRPVRLVTVALANRRLGADDARRGPPGAGACPGRCRGRGLTLPRPGTGGGREPG